MPTCRRGASQDTLQDVSGRTLRKSRRPSPWQQLDSSGLSCLCRGRWCGRSSLRWLWLEPPFDRLPRFSPRSKEALSLFFFFCGSRAPCMFTGRQCRISSSLGDVHLSIGAPRMFIPSMFFFGRERVHSQMRPGCVSVFPPFRLDSPLSLWLSISCLSYQDCAIGACIVKNSTPAARSCPRTPPLTDVFWQGCTQFVVQVASVRPRLITSA